MLSDKCLSTLASRAHFEEGAKTLVEILSSTTRDVEDDGDAIHELHRRIWPAFENLLLNRADNPRKLQKMELVMLRVYWKTLPARLWVVSVKTHGSMSSHRLGLPLPCCDHLIEELEQQTPNIPQTDQALVDLLFVFVLGLPLCFFACDAEKHDRIIFLADNVAAQLWPSIGGARLQIPMRKVTKDYHDVIESAHVARMTQEFDKNFNKLSLWSEDERYKMAYDFGMQGKHFVGTECYEIRLWADKQSQDVHGLIIFKSQDDSEGPLGHVHGGLIATVGDMVTAYACLTTAAMTRKLEISYRSPVPLKSVLRFVGGKRHAPELRKDAILSVVEFFDVRNNLKFVAKGTFSRPRIAKL